MASAKIVDWLEQEGEGVGVREPIPLPAATVAEVVPLAGIRATIALRLASSAHSTAAAALMMQAGATNLVEARERLKARAAEVLGAHARLQ